MDTSEKVLEIYGNDSKEDLIGRIIELECSLKWWLDEHMKNYTEHQYGKRQMRKMLKLFPKVNDEVPN